MNPRFYLPGIRETGQVVSLGGEEYHHLRRVLRLKAGDGIALFDGEGRGFAGEILEMLPGEAKVLLGPEEPGDRESPLRLILMAALSKGEKFEWVVQKATELGVAEILPVTTRRSDIRPVAGRRGGKADRWRRVALEACKQSGRNRLPVVHEAEGLAAALARRGAGAGIVMDPEGPALSWESLRERLSGASPLRVAVGPEGGWSPEEREQFREAGFLPLRLGPRVLRTETAAIVSAALLQFLVGDLGTPGRPGPSAGGDKALKTKV